MHPMLNIAIRAARKAGDIIVRGLERLDKIKIGKKGHHDFYTEVDQAAEKEIIQILSKAYPNHGFLGEESGENASDSDYLWIIDPLDGTTNFVHGFPHFCVSIALKHKNHLDQAVIYDPIRQDLFTASKGAGAQLNGRKLRLSQRKPLGGALVSIGIPFHKLSQSQALVEQLRDLTSTLGGIRRTGSAALDLAYVASGRLDAFCEASLHQWDIAAGALLVRESGGLVTDFKGEEHYLDTGNIVAGSPKVFAGLIQHIQKQYGN